MKKTTFSAEETIEFAVQIGKMLKKGDVIAYTGGLGAGKTTFTRGLAIADDLETTGFYDYPIEESIFAIEWSENISDELPENTIFIDIERVDENIRNINIKGDERFADAGN